MVQAESYGEQRGDDDHPTTKDDDRRLTKAGDASVEAGAGVNERGL